MVKIKLIKFVKTIISLKEKLKCAICLDVMQDVVELDCGHKYCKSCYLEHKSTQKQVSCPLCKKILKRRSTIYDDNYASSLGKFVYNCCENIKSVYKCEVEQLQKQLSEETGVLQSKDNLQQNAISTNQSLAVPSTSKGITQTVKEKGHSREKHDTKKANIRRTKDESVKENCMSAFDKLMNTNQPVTTFNKTGAKRVYTNKKNSNKKPRVEYDILEFDNYANKTAVLQWLHDTRNKFDRLSQTQNIGSDTSEVPVIDLVSVSQVKGTEDEYMPRRSKFRKERAKSLDIEVKKAVPTQKKPNSQVRSVSLENYNIEENTEEEVIKKAEEKVILDLIEDEFLEALDSEMQAIKTSDFDIKRKICNSAKKKAKPLSPTLTTTGWERLTEIEKTIKKTERVPRQLNITTQSTQELKNENIPQANKETITKTDKPNDGLKQTLTNEVVLIESEDEPDKETNTHEAIDVSKKLLTVVLTQADFTDGAKNVKLQKRDDDLIQSVTGNEEAVIENKTRPPELELPGKSCPEDDISEIKQNHRQTYDLEQLENYISENIEVIDKNTSADSDILLHASLQESITADVENRKELEVPNNRTSENFKEKENTDSKDSSSVLLDVLFNMPTQRISHSDNSKLKLGNEVIVIDDDDIEPGEPSLRDNRTLDEERDKKQNTSLDEITKMYDCPTQRIDHSCTDTTDKQSSTEGLLYLFEECLEKCITNLKSADLTVKNHLRNMQFYASKLKLLHRNNNKIIKEKPIVTEVCDAETQIVIDAVNKTVQTESNENNIGVQTENLHCIKCNIDLNENRLPDDVTLISQDTKAAIEHMVNETNIDFKPTLHSTVSNKPSTSHLKPRSQYEEFTCTLDNLNFDTQELVKNRGTITKISPKNTTHKSEVTQSKAQTSLSEMENKTPGNIPGSVLLCSLDSDKSTVSKQVNRKLTYEADKSGKFKRIKRPASDSDSEEEKEAPAKRKCNRFLRDDLTVEFLTNSEVSNFKHNKTSNMESQDSEGVNYDEYLAEVMKKYEDNNFSNSPPKSVKKPKILSPKQELGKRHEEMISNTSKYINPLKRMPTELSTASSKDSFRTASNSLCNNVDDELAADNIFMNEDNLLKLESDIRKYEKIVKAQSSEFSDIIGETEEFTPKKRKRTALNDIPSKDVENKKVFFKDLDLDLCKVLNEETMKKVLDDRKINILANVKIKSQDKKEVKVDEDDLFSDEDIVETTPQKKVADGSAFSQISLNLINNSLPPPKETDNFDFDIVPLPPPPDFQDDIDIPSTPDRIPDDDPTMIDLNKSLLTPDLSQFIFRSPKHSKYLSPCIKQIVKEKEGEQSEMRNISQKGELQDDFSRTPDQLAPQKDHVKQRNVSHSTPIVDGDLIKESIGLSPISTKKSQKMGLTEMAHAAKYTPLNTVTKQTPQKQNLFTSTPKQKSIWNYVKSQSSEQAAPSIGKTKPCIACTRLTKNQVKLIDKLASKDLATFSSQFDGKVTHMIVSVNDNNWVKDYTIKFVSAVAAGIWVLRLDWIEECLKKDCIVSEEPFEVLDISGFPGPRTSRLTRKHNPLFMGYKFFCAEPFLSATKDEIENIVKMLGGKILPDLRSLLVDDGDIGIIIGEGHATQDFEQYEKWVETYRTVTVDIEWLSKCVGQYKILSIRPYVWCSEDNLCDLGYPSALTETVPLTFTETF